MGDRPSIRKRDAAAIADFAAEAHAFRELVDTAATTVPGDLLGQLLIRLTELARAAQRLPGGPTRDGPRRDAEWRAAARRLHKALGPDDLYWRPGADGDEADDPGKVAAASLGDDLADIDLELRHGFALADSGDLAAAAAAWRDGYERRWGGHLEGGLSPLSRLAQPGGSESGSAEGP